MVKSMIGKSKQKILILGGTKEAAILADQFLADGHDVTTSLAGRTKEPKSVSGNLRIGGFSSSTLTGAQGLAEFLINNQFDRMIDATHPFAKQISRNAVAAAQQTGILFEVRTRIPWEKTEGDHWIDAASLEEARDLIPKNARVLLALGSQYIDLFKTRSDVFFLVRMVDHPPSPLALANHKLLIGRPSGNWQIEKAKLEEHTISHIVCRNSGGEGAYAKILAARNIGIQVIMVRQS